MRSKSAEPFSNSPAKSGLRQEATLHAFSAIIKVLETLLVVDELLDTIAQLVLQVLDPVEGLVDLVDLAEVVVLGCQRYGGLLGMRLDVILGGDIRTSVSYSAWLISLTTFWSSAKSP